MAPCGAWLAPPPLRSQRFSLWPSLPHPHTWPLRDGETETQGVSRIMRAELGLSPGPSCRGAAQGGHRGGPQEEPWGVTRDLCPQGPSPECSSHPPTSCWPCLSPPPLDARPVAGGTRKGVSSGPASSGAPPRCPAPTPGWPPSTSGTASAQAASSTPAGWCLQPTASPAGERFRLRVLDLQARPRHLPFRPPPAIHPPRSALHPHPHSPSPSLRPPPASPLFCLTVTHVSPRVPTFPCDLSH